jgi:oligo-1,6-glucosidase
VPDGWDGAELVLGNVADPEPIGARVTLQPWEARVHRRRQTCAGGSETAS